MANPVVPRYEGPVLSTSVRSFLELIQARGFKLQPTSKHAGKTLRVYFGATWYGYINGSVLERSGLLGYRFTAWGHENNACPPSMARELPTSFAQRYSCSLDDFVLQQGGGANAGRTFLVITNPTVAFRVLLQDAGQSVDPSIHIIRVGDVYVEGAVREVSLLRAERSLAARQACLEHYGVACAACRQTIRSRYKGLGVDVIHVHHEEPISASREARPVDPIREMKPLCPNCHAVAHSRTPPYTVAEVATMYRGET